MVDKVSLDDLVPEKKFLVIPENQRSNCIRLCLEILDKLANGDDLGFLVTEYCFQRPQDDSEEHFPEPGDRWKFKDYHASSGSLYDGLRVQDGTNLLNSGRTVTVYCAKDLIIHVSKNEILEHLGSKR